MTERSRIFQVEFTQSEFTLLFNALTDYAESRHHLARKHDRRTLSGKVVHIESKILNGLVERLRFVYPEEWCEILHESLPIKMIATPDATKDLLARIIAQSKRRWDRERKEGK